MMRITYVPSRFYSVIAFCSRKYIQTIFGIHFEYVRLI